MTTYNSLISDILTWINRSDTDTVNQVPNFIYLAEQQICRDCKNVGLVKNVISAANINGGGFVPGQYAIAKPTGWRETLSFTNGANGTINIMETRGIDFLNVYWPNLSTTGIPLYYADFGQNFWKVAPTPDSNYPYQVSYLEFPLPLSVNNQTNWLTDFIPDILLFCSLMNAMPYVKDDERLPVWKQEYQTKVQALNMQDMRRKIDRQTDRGAD